MDRSQRAYTAYGYPENPTAKGLFYYQLDGNLLMNVSLAGQAISFDVTADEGKGSLKPTPWGIVALVAFSIATVGIGTMIIGAAVAAIIAIVITVIVTQRKIPFPFPAGVLNQINSDLPPFSWMGQNVFTLNGIQLPGRSRAVGPSPGLIQQPRTPEWP